MTGTPLFCAASHHELEQNWTVAVLLCALSCRMPIISPILQSILIMVSRV